MSVRHYFDLNQSARFGSPKSNRPRVGAIPSGAGPAGSPAPGTEGGLNLGWQVGTYLILLLAILASRFLDLYRAGVPGEFQLDWAYLLFIGIVSLLAFPVVYREARLNKGQPVFMHVCLIFTAGMGWEKIVATAVGK